MISSFTRQRWGILKIMALVSVVVPIGITVYELTILGRTSVVFLGDYPSAVGIVVVIYYGILLTIAVGWVLRQIHKMMRLRNEQTKNEIVQLQNQVSPHFFFNMLNNLYGMVDKDVEKSKSLILKLSDLMRYNIYEGERKRVPLYEEVAYLKNFVELHRMRYHKDIDIRFDTSIEDETLEVMPLLFIILLENAFKHGVENLREEAYVHITLTTEKNHLIFEVENNFDPDELPEQRGIGIKNLNRRLDLAYPKRHKLTLTSHDSIHRAKLELHP
ncbi:MAG: histidine kinase [Pricia sp.]